MLKSGGFIIPLFLLLIYNNQSFFVQYVCIVLIGFVKYIQQNGKIKPPLDVFIFEYLCY